MPNYIALLRAINVGGRNKVVMSDLRTLCEELGFTRVRSWLPSGNLILQSDRQSTAALERRLMAETEKRLGLAVDYIVRSAKDWEKIIVGNPFPKEAERGPSHLVVIFLRTAPAADEVEALRSAIKGPEMVSCIGKELYTVYPAGIGESKLTNALIEKKLGTRGTGRNWNTVLKLGELSNERC